MKELCCIEKKMTKAERVALASFCADKYGCKVRVMFTTSKAAGKSPMTVYVYEVSR